MRWSSGGEVMVWYHLDVALLVCGRCRVDGPVLCVVMEVLVAPATT
jgi:hypothetical protein